MISILVNGSEKRDYIDWKSFKKEDIITSQVDTLNFTAISYQGRIWKPVVDSEIIVYDGADKIFGGIIVKVQETIEGKLLNYDVQCIDYTYLLDRKLVFDTYDDHLVEDIVAHIIADYAPTFTGNHVEATGITLEYILFNYKKPSDCLKELAELIGYDYYIDYNKDIHFFSKAVGETTPFDLTDTNGNYVFNSLEIVDDTKQLKNIVYVRGGEYVGDSRTDKVGAGDNVTKIFKLPYRYDVMPTVTVGGGAPLNVGVDFLDDPATHDCLWNYQEKVLRFATAPVTGDVLVTGTPLVTVIVKAKNSASVSVYGNYEFVIVDKLIKTKEAARQRAQAEFIDYALPIKNATLKTNRSGLRSGQRINIQSDIRTLNQDFTITKVVSKTITPDRFEYEVSASTARVMGIIEFLQKQIDDTNKKIGVMRQEGEVLDVLMDLTGIDTMTFSETLKLNDPDFKLDLMSIDTMTIGETLIRIIKDSPPLWVYGGYFPVNDADRKRPAFYDRSCNYV